MNRLLKHLFPLVLAAALLCGLLVPAASAASKPQTAELVVLNFPAGPVLKDSKLTLTAAEGAPSNLTFRYTTDGSTPTKNSTKYTSPIVIGKDMTVKVMALSGSTQGTVESYTFTVYTTRLGSLKENAASIRYLMGYSDGTFCPDQPITRYEVAQALTYLLELGDGSTAQHFPDMHAQYQTAVAKLVEAGLISGYPDGTFLGNVSMTRAQMCKILCLILDYKEEADLAERSFPDVKDHWAIGYIGALVKSGYLKGYDDGTFRPDRAVSRAEFAALINRIAGRKDVEGDVLEYIDVLFDFWAYDDIHNAALNLE